MALQNGTRDFIGGAKGVQVDGFRSRRYLLRRGINIHAAHKEYACDISR